MVRVSTRTVGPEFTLRIQQQVAALSAKANYHSLELKDGRIIPGLVDVASLRARVDAFPIPADLRGRRVLDVGAASGWNSFEMERRGAEVMAIDCVQYDELPIARELLESRVDYRIADVTELGPETHGTFDYVLFFGVLYHLRHPLLGLEKVCALTREAAFIESYVTDSVGEKSDECSMTFYEIDELGGQIDNWFGPTTKCLLALCRSAGFARVEFKYFSDLRAGVTCYRKWEDPPANPTASTPWICSVVNNRTSNIYFHKDRDEYMCIYFRSTDPVTRETLRAEVDGYGVPALAVASARPGEWQANLRCPPGMAVGKHQVRMRSTGSAFSNEFTIEVLPLNGAEEPVKRGPVEGGESAGAPVLVAVENSLDRSSIFHGFKSEWLCVRFKTGETGLDRGLIAMRIDEEEMAVEILTDLGDGEHQVSVRFPARLVAGRHSLRLRTGNSGFSEALEFTVESA
jgi:SAM-dependent methyltransferase